MRSCLFCFVNNINGNGLGLTSSENGNGEYFPLLSSQDASNTNYSVTIKTHTPSPDSNDNAAGEAESTMQATSQYTKLNQTRTFPHHSNIDRDHPHHVRD